MSERYIRAMENALRTYIEDLLQSENGPSKSDIKYINAERERIRNYQFGSAA